MNQRYYSLDVFILTPTDLVFPFFLFAATALLFIGYARDWFHQNITGQFPGPPENGSLLFALCFVLSLRLIGYWMDKKRIYIKV